MSGTGVPRSQLVQLLRPLVIADVALAFGEAGEGAEHDVLAVVEGVPARLGHVVVAHILFGDVGSEEIGVCRDHGQTRRVQSSRFAAPGGTSPFTSASTWRTVSNAWLSLAGGV